MAIQHLPQQTVRRLGASQVLTDSAALVKELVENALDAHATNINVEIHANTIDVIQVRDNGHGVSGGDDRQIVAKRYCTSKITSEDDLKKVGGSTLGFRGEALASAAAMSGSLTITTRTQSEQVAIALKVNQLGDVFATERASLPIGTTVHVTDFFAGNPVRRQIAFKNPEKCIKNVKRLLQAYAFARPAVRLSLKVLKAKHDKNDWLFAPSPSGKVEDAACKIVGVACASQCRFSIVEHAGFKVSALLPRSDADQAKIENSGSFISVDGRPVSDGRGIFKQLVKIFRETLKRANSRFSSVTRPFLYLGISCPADSYDVNVEPSKDDVIFTNPEDVIEATTRLFDAAYETADHSNKLQTAEKVSGEQCIASAPASNRIGSQRATMTELDLPPSEHVVQPRVDPLDRLVLAPEPEDNYASVGPMKSVDERSAKDIQLFRPNMYGCDEGDMDMFGSRPQIRHNDEDLEELREAQRDPRVTNPWVFAKLNGSRRPPLLSLHEESAPVLASGTQSSVPSTSSPIAQQLAANSITIACLPTPQNSSPSQKRPCRLRDQEQVPEHPAESGRVAPHAPMLPAPDAPETSLDLENASAPVKQLHRKDQSLDPESILARTEQWIVEGPFLDAVPSTASATTKSRKGVRSSGINKPFVPPAKIAEPRENMRTDLSSQNRAKHRQMMHRRSRKNDDTSLDFTPRGEPSDDPESLLPPRGSRDIRECFAAADLSHLPSVPLEDQENHATNAHQRRATPVVNASQEDVVLTHNAILSSTGFMPASEITALQAHVKAREDANSSMPNHQSNGMRLLPEATRGDQVVDDAHVTNRRKLSRRKSSRKLSRPKSANLPLERIPADSAMHNVEVHMALGIDDVLKVANKIEEKQTVLAWDQAAITACDAFGLPFQPDEVQKLAAVLKELLLLKVSSAEMVEDLGELLSMAIELHHEDVSA